MNNRGVLYTNLEYAELENELIKHFSTAYRLFRYFILNMDKNNEVNIKVCSYKAMQTHLELSRVSISRAVKTLKQYGIITIDKIGNNNSYTINPNIVTISFKAKYPVK